jgi:hypothetical protein
MKFAHGIGAKKLVLKLIFMTTDGLNTGRSGHNR